MKVSPTFQRHVSLIALAIATIAYYPRFIKDPAGLKVFPAAAECLLRGEVLLHCDNTVFVSPFAYPPFIALLSMPLVAMPIWLRELTWYVVLIGTLFGSLRICEMLARQLFPGDWSEQELTQFRVLSFILSLKFILAVLENQAFDSVAFFFVAIGMLALTKQRFAAGGASLAIAAALKVTPLLFLPYLLIKRRFLSASVFVLVFAFLICLPDILLPTKQSSHVGAWLYEVIIAQFYKNPDVLYPTFWMNDSPMNQSFRASLARIISGGIEIQLIESRQLDVLSRAVIALYVLPVGLIMLKSLRNDRLLPIDGALLVVSTLLLSPVSSQSHFVGLILPYSLLAAAMLRCHAMTHVVGAFLLTSYLLATGSSNDLVGRTFTGWALWHNLPMWGTLTLTVALCVLIWVISGKQATATASKL